MKTIFNFLNKWIGKYNFHLVRLIPYFFAFIFSCLTKKLVGCFFFGIFVTYEFYYLTKDILKK